VISGASIPIRCTSLPPLAIHAGDARVFHDEPFGILLSVGRGLADLYLRELRFCSNLRGNRTLARHRSDFHTNAIWQTGAFRGDGKGFVHRSDVEKKIAPNRLLGFCERAIGDDSVLTRNDFSLAFQWIPGNRFTLFGQASEPGHPILGDLLQLLWRKTFSQLGTAK
jgi:hypothetical protein